MTNQPTDITEHQEFNSQSQTIQRIADIINYSNCTRKTEHISHNDNKPSNVQTKIRNSKNYKK